MFAITLSALHTLQGKTTTGSSLSGRVSGSDLRVEYMLQGKAGPIRIQVGDEIVSRVVLSMFEPPPLPHSRRPHWIVIGADAHRGSWVVVPDTACM